MDYLRAFLEKEGALKRPLPLTDKTDKPPSVSFVSYPGARFGIGTSPDQPPEAAGAHRAADLRYEKRDTHLRAHAQDDLCPNWTREVTPDSRHPLIPSEVRSKIRAIETEARRLGWPPELLWNANFWDLPRGLAAVLDADDEISEVTADHIGILKVRRDLMRFRRHVA